MKTVWKYRVPVADDFAIDMPVGTQVLTMQMQRGQPCIWALIDAKVDAPFEQRKFRMFGTGHEIEEDIEMSYVGTFQIGNGLLVFHVFEEVGPR